MLYRLNIKMDSAIHGNINSNTIFGLICEAYKIKYGDEKLRELLNGLVNSTNELIVTNPLKVNTFEFEDMESTAQINRITLDRLGNKNDLSMSQVKCINEFDVLIYTSLSEDVLNSIIKVCTILGIGSAKNVGFGTIKSIKLTAEKLRTRDGKTVRCMSNIFPSENTPVYGDIRFNVRHGITSKGKEQSTLIMIEAGSEFINSGIITTGQIVYDAKSDTYINGKALLV